ncbi:hypothetical protein C2S51_003770 [Perilla frutescens var. frutescens]|nr:hypothetical protein C2S51_003770 [Perilla frutescens var. frutescens]
MTFQFKNNSKICPVQQKDKKLLHVAAIKTTWYKTKEELKEAEKEMIDCLNVLEDKLGEKPYFGGETVGYMDVVLGGFCCWFPAYHEWGSFSIDHHFPKLMAWAQRCMQRESFSKSPTPTSFAILCCASENSRAYLSINPSGMNMKPEKTICLCL